MKKQHPCGANLWEIIRLGADIKIKCLNCGRTVLIPRIEFNKRLKKIVIQQLLFGVIGKLQDVRVLMEKQEMVEMSCAIVHYQKGINQQEQT